MWGLSYGVYKGFFISYEQPSIFLIPEWLKKFPETHRMIWFGGHLLTYILGLNKQLALRGRFNPSK